MRRIWAKVEEQKPVTDNFIWGARIALYNRPDANCFGAGPEVPSIEMLYGFSSKD